jgi:hypothetical protein
MVHGFTPFFREGIKPLLGNFEAMKLSAKEGQLMGLVTERTSLHRMSTFAELGDPLAKNTAFERFITNASRFATRWNGLALWTDVMQAVSGTLSQNRILTGVAGEGDTRFLAYLGIDATTANRIAKQFAEHGETRDTVKIANTEKWTDEKAVRAYRAAVRKDVDSIIVRKGVGDLPLFSSTPTGKAILQFRSFTLAAHQRVMLKGMQENTGRFIGGLAVMTSLGMLAATARAYTAGAAAWERFKKASENPGYLVGEGLDLTGIFPLAFEVSNTVEKVSGASGAGAVNPLKSPLMAAGNLAVPGSSMQGSSVRFATRDPLSALLGPSAGLVGNTIPRALGGVGLLATGEDPSLSQQKAMTGLVPFSSYIGMRQILQAVNGDAHWQQQQQR